MADSQLPPRYVGYRRPSAPVPESAAARLVELLRCQRAVLLLQGAIVVFAISCLFNLHAPPPAYRVVVVVVLVCYGVGAYVAFGLFPPMLRLRRELGAIPAGAVFLTVLLVLTLPAKETVPFSGIVAGVANIIGLPAILFITAELKRNGFTSWRKALQEIKRVQLLEREAYVPPIPENLYTGEPPKSLA